MTVTTNQRTDQHRPVELVTEDYEYVGAYDSAGGYNPREIANRQRLRQLIHEHGVGIHSHDRNDGQCDHCGAALRYKAVLKHLPTNGYIEVGEQCLGNRFERSTAEFQQLRKNAQLDREQHRIRQAVDAFVQANPDLAWMGRGAEMPAEYASNNFLADVARKLNTYGEISERQIAAVRNAMAREAEYQARKREREQARAAEQASRPHASVPTGRVQITGEVFKVRYPEPEDMFPTTKMLVADDRGFRVWGSVPASLSRVGRGDRVSFSAEVQASKDDPEFGFYSRPTKAQFLAEAAS